MSPKPSKKSVSIVKSLSPKSYQKLLAILRKEIARGQERINTYIDFEKIRTNWNVARHIHVHVLDGADRAPNGLYAQLAEDLQVSVRYIQAVVRFYRAYPGLPMDHGLKWSHYVFLLHVSAADREKMRQRVIREKLSVDELQLLISKTKVDSSAGSAVLSAVPGNLWTYRLLKTHSIQDSARYVTVDCGFSITFDQALDPEAVYQTGDICESIKEEQTYRISRPRDGKAADLYTYMAVVERFVDGDTLLVEVDVGFGIKTHQKLRLRGIDCPELDTLPGQRAKQFIQGELKDCPFVIIKTHKSDKYDRYLVDIFFLPKETDPAVVASQGKYLNQELINAKLASVWTA